MGGPVYNLVLIDLTTDATSAALRPAQVLSQLIDAAGAFVETLSQEYMGVSVTFRVGADPTDRQVNEIAVNFRDTLPGAPGALAYHQVLAGVPDIEIGCDLYGNLIDDGKAMSVGFTHELAEMLGDPGGNGWKDKGTGTMCAEETCDMVQNTWWKTPNGVAVTNFLWPNYFIPGSAGPWDHLGVLASPDDTSHGYEIRALSPDSIQQVPLVTLMKSPGGVHHVGYLTPEQRRAKSHVYARTRRRGLTFPPSGV